jgi:hypothetical protein
LKPLKWWVPRRLIRGKREHEREVNARVLAGFDGFTKKPSISIHLEDWLIQDGGFDYQDRSFTCIYRIEFLLRLCCKLHFLDWLWAKILRLRSRNLE